MPTNQIEIYIDGTICNSFFPNLKEKADILELKKRILETPLYLDFVKYYKKISKKDNLKIYFITGRRKKDFEFETKQQLETLNLQDHQLIFYPNHYTHCKVRYNTFKIYEILKIGLENNAVLSEIHVYDDLCDYYPRLLEFATKLEISKFILHIIKDPAKFWKLKLLEVSLLK